MQRSAKTALGLAGAAAAAALGWSLATGPTGADGTGGKAAQPCDGRDAPAADAPARLPLDLPLLDGATVLRVGEQGRTVVAFTALAGGADDLVRVRDRVVQDLAAAGYRSVATDQEVGFEADAQLEGPHPATVNVTPLCRDVLVVRYKVEQ